jgi:predicted metal-dependent hydrolase
MAVTDLLEEGLLLFNAGRFYDAHEVWEDLWRETANPALKTCYQGLIQAAVGLHHLTRDNTTGARSQLAKSIRNLQAGTAEATGLDIDGLVIQLNEVLGGLPGQPRQPLRIARLK